MWNQDSSSVLNGKRRRLNINERVFILLLHSFISLQLRLHAEQPFNIKPESCDRASRGDWQPRYEDGAGAGEPGTPPPPTEEDSLARYVSDTGPVLLIVCCGHRCSCVTRCVSEGSVDQQSIQRWAFLKMQTQLPTIHCLL